MTWELLLGVVSAALLIFWTWVSRQNRDERNRSGQ
jgi:hypothetical protein